MAGRPLTADELRARKAALSPLQRRVTQEEGTEPPFRNEYVDQHAAGIYVDVVSGAHSRLANGKGILRVVELEVGHAVR